MQNNNNSEINRILEILEQQSVPTANDNKVLRAIWKHHTNNSCMAILIAYNYGLMRGKCVW